MNEYFFSFPDPIGAHKIEDTFPKSNENEQPPKKLKNDIINQIIKKDYRIVIKRFDSQ